MSDDLRQTQGPISRVTFAVLLLLAGGLTVAVLSGSSEVFGPVVATVIVDGLTAAAVIVAAGGWGYLAVRFLAPACAPAGLRATTAAALGLWMLSTAVLALGSFTDWWRTEWLWWPVVGMGVLAALVGARRHFDLSRLRVRTDGRALVWLAVAVAVGFWLSGASVPPGLHATSESYDVLEYHLQAPREFYHAGSVGPLAHNVYSHYPLGVEMLFLLGMVLRGGPYEGMYLAQFLHGGFGVLAVVAVFASLKKNEHVRGRTAASLLATTPMLVLLGSLALVELAQVCYLAISLLWLRHWISDRDWRSAACIGLMLGASCATKYLAVGLVAGPMLAVMAAVSVRGVRRLGQTALAAALAALAFAPWLVRNFVSTGNPVFPLATEVLGRGDWPAQCQQRWLAGHGPQHQPPVPKPPGWQQTPEPSRTELFYRHFVADQTFGPLLKLLTLAAVAALFALGPRAPGWDWAIAGVLGIQLAVWSALTHQMPSRFLAPAVAPMCLLAGGAIARLCLVRSNPLRRRPAPAAAPWGLPAAAVVLAAALLVNLLVIRGAHESVTQGRPIPPADGQIVARHAMPFRHAASLPQGSRLMLVGAATPFYFPAGTVYATVFNAQPLDEMVAQGLSPQQMAGELRRMGVTHLWIDWSEIWRLANTYGFPASLSAELFERQQSGRAQGLEILDRLQAAGLAPVENILAFTPQPYWQRQELATGPSWPAITIYSLPAEPSDGKPQ